jgi:hypothetical protein
MKSKGDGWVSYGKKESKEKRLNNKRGWYKLN